MPQEADFDVASFEYGAQTEEDKKLLVKFFVKPRNDSAASLKAGRPVFKDVEYIDIKIPGDRTGGVCRPATYVDKQRFGPHYVAFKTRTELPLEGTPLVEWPLITRSLAEELAFHNVKTVEQLSTMADVHSGKFMGLNTIKAKALKWLEQAGEEAKVHQLQQSLMERDERITDQDTKISELQNQMTQLLDKLELTPATTSSLSSALDEPVAPAAAETEPTAEAATDDTKTPRRRKRRAKVVDGNVGNAL